MAAIDNFRFETSLTSTILSYGYDPVPITTLLSPTLVYPSTASPTLTLDGPIRMVAAPTTSGHIVSLSSSLIECERFHYEENSTHYQRSKRYFSFTHLKIHITCNEL